MGFSRGFNLMFYDLGTRLLTLFYWWPDFHITAGQAEPQQHDCNLSEEVWTEDEILSDPSIYWDGMIHTNVWVIAV